MCGIAGVLALDGHGQAAPRAALLAMAAALRHRGPDEAGLYRGDGVAFAHTRLSILDLAHGQQPLSSADGRRWIAFNGEIFNHVELREELAALGHRFRTRSDTEVLLVAYQAWGEAAFARFDGQWAVAIWDEAARSLLLCRDRVGILPLHLCRHGDRLYFASEVKAIFAADASIPRRFDPLGLEQTFTFWSIVPPQSVFAGVEELRPGHLRVYQGGRVREQAYWQPQYAPRDGSGGFAGSFDDAAAAVGQALDRATERRLRADVPVGSYLSGGLDSSLVAALGRRHCRGAFHTFSLRFEDAEYDETPFQRQMVERLGSEHHDIVVSRADIAAALPAVVAHAERPILRTAPAPLFLLSQLVRRHGIKVVLTGEGADEMFAGYDLFREGKVRRFWARQPQSRWRPRLLERLYPYMARSPVAQQAVARQFFGRDLQRHAEPGFAHALRWQSTAALKRLLRPELRAAVQGRDVTAELLADLPPEFARWPALAQDQYLEVRTLLSGYLLSSQGDRMLMGHSVEGRFPFLDQDVIALADSLPAAFKLRGLAEKHVLKAAAQGLVPDAIVARQKQPYRAPDAMAFTGDGRPEWVDELLEPAAVEAAGVFAPPPVQQLWHKCRGKGEQFSNADNMALVAVLSTQLLHRHFIAERPGADADLALAVDVDRSAPATR